VHDRTNHCSILVSEECSMTDEKLDQTEEGVPTGASHVPEKSEPNCLMCGKPMAPTFDKDGFEYIIKWCSVECKEKQICPRCDGPLGKHPALSRRDNKTNICSDCGTAEAMEDYRNRGAQ